MVSHIYLCNSIIQKIKCHISLIGKRNKQGQFTYHQKNPCWVHAMDSQHEESRSLTTRNFNIQFFYHSYFLFCEVTRQNKNIRVVTKISSCQANTKSRRGIKQLGISFLSILLPFSFKSSREPRSQ